MLLIASALVIAGVLSTPPQSAPGPPMPLVKLVLDLDAAMERAHLTEVQRSQLQADRAVLEAARAAKEQGKPVNRRQVTGAVKGIYKVMESGAFTSQDQQKLKSDIDILRRH